jgi:hypothetical protein
MCVIAGGDGPPKKLHTLHLQFFPPKIQNESKSPPSLHTSNYLLNMMSKSRLYSTTLLALRLTKTTAFAPPLPTSPSFSTRLFSTPPTRYLLSYDYVPDVLEKRGPHREGHLGLARAMIEEGVCVSGGPSAVPGEGVPGGGTSRETVLCVGGLP